MLTNKFMLIIFLSKFCVAGNFPTNNTKLTTATTTTTTTTNEQSGKHFQGPRPGIRSWGQGVCAWEVVFILACNLHF